MGRTLHDTYTGLNSPVHRLDPRTKTVLTLAYVVVVVSTPPTHLLAFVVYTGLLTWIAALARVPLLYVGLRAAAVLPFSLLAAVWLPLIHQGPTVSLAGGWLHLSVPGLWLLLGVVMKSCLGASAAILLGTTTPFPALLHGLRKLGVPAVLVDMLGLTYRYLFVLIEQAIKLRRAAAARGYRPRWLGQALLIGRLIGLLFVRSYERAERVYQAMVLRGYQGQMPVPQPLRLAKRDLVATLLFLPLLLVVRGYVR